MGNPFRDVQHLVVVRAQFRRDPLFESVLAGPQVDDDVVDRSTGAPHQLGLLVRRSLIVHAAERSLLLVEGDAALRESWVQAARLEFPPAPCSRKKPPLILDLFRLDDESPAYSRLNEDHWQSIAPACVQPWQPPNLKPLWAPEEE